jgi:hypothetical protein
LNLEEKKQWILGQAHLCPAPYTKRDFRIQNFNQFGLTCCCNLDTTRVTETDPAQAVDAVILAMDQNRRARECARCVSEESQGHTSERMRLMMGWTPEQLEAFDRNRQLPQDQEVEVAMKFSTVCNLACRSCNPNDSTLFAQVTNTQLALTKWQDDLADVPAYWQAIIDDIQQQHARHGKITVHPIGGEPFVTAGFVKLVDWLCDTGLARDVQLRVTTNFVVPIGDQWIEKLSQFRSVQIVASIDSVGHNYNQVRWPAEWNKIEHNLDHWASVVSQDSSRFNHMCVIMVFTINNIFYIREILDWWHAWLQHHPGFNLDLQNIHVYRPAFLKPEVLPDRYRRPLLEIMRPLIDHPLFARDRHPQLRDFVINTVRVLQETQPESPSLWNDYVRYTAEYDRRTKSNSFSSNAALFQLLAPEHVALYQQQFDCVDRGQPIYGHQSLL